MPIANFRDLTTSSQNGLDRPKSSINILLLIDNQQVEDSLIKIMHDLEDLNANLISVNNYDDAFAEISKGFIELCLIGPPLVDHSCPEFITSIKASDPTLPIIIIVGDTPNTVELESIHAGSCDYLVRSSITHHQLELSLRYGINRRKREQRLLWVVETQKAIKEMAVELANIRDPLELSSIDNYLDKLAGLFDSRAMLLLDCGKARVLWTSDAKLLALIQSRSDQVFQECWQQLLLSLTARTSVCNRSRPDLARELEKVGIWKDLQGNANWCACAPKSASSNTSILVVFSINPSISFDSDRVAAISDICDLMNANLKRADSEKALNESKRQYRHLVESLEEGIVLCDMDENIVQINSRLSQQLRRNPEEILGKKSWEILIPESEKEDITRRLRHRHLGISETYELEIIRSDLTRFWSEVRASPVYDEYGSLIGSMASITDISKKIQAIEQSVRLQREIAQSEQLKDVFEISTGIAAEINSSLELIESQLSTIEKQQLNNSDLNHRLGSIISEVTDARKILKKLSQIAEHSAGVPKVANPSSLVSDSIRFLEGFISESTELIHESSQDDLKIEIDPLNFRQILLSAILESTSASRTGGRIVIRHSRREIQNNQIGFSAHTPLASSYAVITIEDSNPCRSAEQIRRMLLPRFGEGDEVRKSSIELASLSNLMLSIGGLIDISTIPENDLNYSKDKSINKPGIKVELSFPVFKMHTESKMSKTESRTDDPEFTELSSGDKNALKENRKKVLVVDDEEMLVQLMLRFLELANISAVGFSRPDLALSWFSENSADVTLAILDLKMSGIDGRECFSRMLEIDPKTRVAFLSGFIEPEVEQRMLRQGALRFFQKPLRYPELIEWIKFTLNPE